LITSVVVIQKKRLHVVVDEHVRRVSEKKLDPICYFIISLL